MEELTRQWVAASVLTRSHRVPQPCRTYGGGTRIGLLRQISLAPPHPPRTTVLTAALLYSPQVAAKRAKNYATADDLRRQLRDLGIEPDDMAALAPAAARRGGGGVRRGGRGGREEAAAGRGEDDTIDAMEEEWRAAEAHEKHVALAAQWLTARRNKVHPNTP